MASFSFLCVRSSEEERRNYDDDDDDHHSTSSRCSTSELFSSPFFPLPLLHLLLSLSFLARDSRFSSSRNFLRFFFFLFCLLKIARNSDDTKRHHHVAYSTDVQTINKTTKGETCTYTHSERHVRSAQQQNDDTTKVVQESADCVLKTRANRRCSLHRR